MPPTERAAPVFDLGEMLGGRRGVIDATTPGIVLVICDTFAPLPWAIGASIVAALVIAVLRRVRGEPLRQAGMGVGGLALAAALAAFTGDAKNYFLPGILLNAAYAVGSIISIVIGRPALAYIAALLDRGYAHWREDRDLYRAAVITTAMWAALFSLRAIVQGYLYVHDNVNWLAPVKLGMGLPLFVVGIAVTLFVLEERRRDPDEAQSENSDPAPAS